MSQNRQHQKTKTGVISKETPKAEEPEADFTASEETEEFDAGTPEVEEFEDEESLASAESTEVNVIENAEQLNRRRRFTMT